MPDLKVRPTYDRAPTYDRRQDTQHTQDAVYARGSMGLSHDLVRSASIAVVAALSLLLTGSPVRTQSAPSSFGSAVATLSEPGGYFDTDNLISNESSFQQVIPELQRRNVRGGAYVGVGPDQNFTYIAATRPAVAYIVDIRRDNVLLHLLFKAIFHHSRTRVEYLALLFGRSVPADIDRWREASIDRLLRYVDDAPKADTVAVRWQLDTTIRGFGVSLTADELQTIAGFHQRFVEAGLSLRFQSAGRPPQWNYPTYRDLLVDTDAAGRHSHFLASEDAFQFVRTLQEKDLVIPLVGDLGGPAALVRIGKAIAARGDKLTAFYASNVEFYLFRDGSFGRFAANLKQIPHTGNAVVIRSFFNRGGLVPARPGDNSASQLQAIDDLLSGVAAGRVRTYSDLVVR